MASSLDDYELIIPVKVGEEDQLFESVTAQKIAEKLKEAGFEIKKSQVILEEPIKESGEFSAIVRFEHNLEATIRVIVAREENEEKI